jgi:S1-C subfamily serine protease
VELRLSLAHGSVLVGLFVATFPLAVRAQEDRDEPVPTKPSEPAPESDEPAPSKPSVEYGAVDASTVRVFAIGTVGLNRISVRGYPVSLADPLAGHGTGFSVGHGLIVTARHVVENGQHLVVRLPGEGGFYAARLVYEDKDADVAVLHIDATLPTLQISTGSMLRVRQTVFAIGYPLDPSRTQAQSARGIVAGQKDDDTIQLDMALNPGNSGGPLVDEKDRVVGMVVARGNPEKGVQGIGFAVRTDRLAKAIKEAQRRLDAGQIAELTDRQRHSAVVVDELVQKGVFHDVRETADMKEELKSGDVQKSLDSLIGRIEDPDLLAFVGGQLWNVYVALWAATDAELDSVGLTREKANDLAARFGFTSGTACRKARGLDGHISDRSPIVDVVLATWRDAEPPPPPTETARVITPSTRPVARKKLPPNAYLLIRGGVELAHLGSGASGTGFGVGMAVLLIRKRLAAGAVRYFPRIGVGFGFVTVTEQRGSAAEDDYTHTYLLGEFGVVADLWPHKNQHLEVGVAWVPGIYLIDKAGWNSEAETRLTVDNVRFDAGYRWGAFSLGAAFHIIGRSNYWVTPVVLSFVL